MSLADALIAEQAQGGRTSCQTCLFLASLKPAERKEWNAVLRHPRLTGATISRALAKRVGRIITQGAIQHHRKVHP